MTSRERVRTALNHKEPDRMPIDLGGTFLTSAPVGIQRAIAAILGLQGEADPRFASFDNRIQEYFGCDLRSIEPAASVPWGFSFDGPHQAPLREANLDDLDRYFWPEPNDALVAGIEERARFLHDKTDYCICAAQIGAGIFESGCYLRGFEEWLLDTAINHEFVHALNRKVLETNKKLGDLYYGAIGRYVDLVLIGDDLATQTAPFVSADTFRSLFKPYFAEYVASIKRHCPHAKIAHHCCGSSISLLDDLSEIGVEVINPVQTTAVGMQPDALAQKKPALAFLGGVDLQHVLPYGSREEVELFVKDLILKLGVGGGYILAPCHTVPADVKPENLIAMLEAARKWGTYPLKA